DPIRALMAVPQPIQDRPSRAIAVALPQELRRYARTATKWRVGCTVELLRDGGETYAAMLAAIAGARRTIELETYILAADRAGDLNIANDYAPVSDGGVGWHDLHCRVRGPIVLDLARLFRRTWMRAGGAIYPPPPPPDSAAGIGGTAIARMLENTGRRKRASI